MSHEDAVSKITKKFSSQLLIQKFKINNNRKFKEKIYGVQFHPEVTHTDNGKQIFKNFLFLICKIKKKWNINFSKNRLIN